MTVTIRTSSGRMKVIEKVMKIEQRATGLLTTDRKGEKRMIYRKDMVLLEITADEEDT